MMGELPISCLKASALRTFLSTAQRHMLWGFIREPSSEAYLRLCQLIQSFKRLCILDLHATNVGKVPRSIYKLKHLTYLELSKNSELKRLPNSITRLQNLQTLNLNGCSSLEELPRGIRKLVSLRNLDIDGCDKLSYVPRGLGQLNSLHRLTRFILPPKKALAKDCCKLGELNELNDIGGSLSIENLGGVTDAIAESKAANLIGKYSLEFLALKWGDFDTNDAVIVDRDEALLGGLQPHSNLQKLMITGYRGESFPKWMTENLVSSLSNLVEADFSCKRCKSLPPLGQLPHLKTLQIWWMTELEYIELDHSSTSTASLPSLLGLEIYGCMKLKAMPPAPHLEELSLTEAHLALINMIVGLNKLKSLDIITMEFLECVPEECWGSLASLESLRINGCPRLTSLSPLGMRHLSNLVDLDIQDCEELDLCKDESGNNNLILDSHGGLHHSLRSVEIFELPKLASLPQWLLQASNLERLDIYKCNNLKDLQEFQSLQQLEIRECSFTSVPEGVPRLASLTHLTIYDCKELDLPKDAGGNILDFHGGLHNLRSVDLFILPKLVSLPQWLHQLSNLEHLRIRICNNLKELLPEQIDGTLQSLQELEISQCRSLTSLPEGMRRLASLTHLTIFDCPELERRCKSEGGEDWYKIAHIPNIDIRL